MGSSKTFLLLLGFLIFVSPSESSLLDYFWSFIYPTITITRTCLNIPKNLHKSVESNYCNILTEDPSLPENKIITSNQTDTIANPNNMDILVDWLVGVPYNSPYTGKKTDIMFYFEIEYDSDPANTLKLKPIIPSKQYSDDNEKYFAKHLTAETIASQSDSVAEPQPVLNRKNIVTYMSVPKSVKCNTPLTFRMRFYTMEVPGEEVLDYMYIIYKGSCFVGQQSTRSLLVLVLAPQFVYLTLGSTFFLVGIAALLLPRPSITPSPILNTLHPNPLIRNQREGAKSPAELYKRQKQLVIRVGAFVCFYGLVMICLTCTIFYEWWGRDSWLRAPEPTKSPKVTTKPLLQVFVLRIVVFLGAGVLAAAWIWWPNAISVWRRLPPCKQPPHKCHPHPVQQVPVVRCYSTGSTTPTPHQLHHLGRLSPPQHPLLHQHPIVINGQLPHRSHKKHRKHRKHHSGSETRV